MADQRHSENSSNQMPSTAAAQGMSQASGKERESNNTSPVSMFESLRIRNFQYLSLGGFFTSAAAWLQMTTLSWVVYDLTGSGTILGAINGIRIIPMLLVTPMVGVLADRISRQHIVSTSQFALFVLTFLLAIDLALDTVQTWHLFLFVILVAIANTVNMPARGALVYDVVPRHMLPNAIAWNQIATSVSRAVGPMLAGIVIVFAGAATNFFIQSVAYLCIMATILMIRLPAATRAKTAPTHAFFREMREGFAFVGNNPNARMLFVISLVSPLFLIPTHQALMPILAKQMFHSGAFALGIMFSAIGVGAIFGGLFTASISRVDKRGLLQIVSLIIFALSHLGFALMGFLIGNVYYVVPFLLITGASEAVYMATNQTVLQLVAPDHMRGRVTSVLQLGQIVWAGTTFLSGIGADLVGASTMAIGQSAIAIIFAVAILAFSPTMRNLRLSWLGEQAGYGEHAAAPRTE
ncbi:MAG: MFS transporter [Dehalococcoidia bacterium]|nr:MFS transporter [Dehalococcoidia bacterium]